MCIFAILPQVDQPTIPATNLDNLIVENQALRADLDRIKEQLTRTTAAEDEIDTLRHTLGMMEGTL